MVKDERSRNGYSEEFDISRLQDIADMAMRDATHTVAGWCLKVNGKRCPDGGYSDLECNVWEMMNRLILFGMDLQRFEMATGKGTSVLELAKQVEEFKFMNPIAGDIRMRDGG